LTLSTGRTAIDGKRFSGRSLIVGKWGKGTTAVLWACCLFLLPNGRVASEQKQETHGAKGSLGTVKFPVSCTAEARESFAPGVALLHSFTYEESAEAFRDAAARDPRCAHGALGTGDDGIPSALGTLSRAGGIGAHRDHPGVAHYLIHAYDNRVLAPQGVAAARAYSKIAPDLPRMPAHIFTQLGLWEDSISSNIAAVAAARMHGDQGEEFHALDYLAYAYLQLGKNDEAEKIRENLPALGDVKRSSLFKINYARAAIRARCALAQQHWTEAENLVADPGVQPQVAAISHWAAALGAAHTGNLQAARQHTEQVRRLSVELREEGDVPGGTSGDPGEGGRGMFRLPGAMARACR